MQNSKLHLVWLSKWRFTTNSISTIFNEYSRRVYLGSAKLLQFILFSWKSIDVKQRVDRENQRVVILFILNSHSFKLFIFIFLIYFKMHDYENRLLAFWFFQNACEMDYSFSNLSILASFSISLKIRSNWVKYIDCF